MSDNIINFPTHTRSDDSLTQAFFSLGVLTSVIENLPDTCKQEVKKRLLARQQYAKDPDIARYMQSLLNMLFKK
ncbi:MAG: hypothetical protein OEZ23_09630 [Gammaproteobacteria bacterium]|nr:hypothetical protein [Gammaproteobacteria bacterium]